MKHPTFHPGEEARVGPYAYDRRMIGRMRRIESIASPTEGEWRYVVSTPSGMASIVLESTLQKILARWEDCAWQPRREAR